MNIINQSIDGGKAFDWGRTSEDYAKFRDIYPQEFYEKILSRGLCRDGRRILDIGTGTGVLPRNMYRFGGKWTGTDISENQIEQAKKMSQGMDINYYVTSAEDIVFPESSFDDVTACQCYWYFDHEKTAPVFNKVLKKGGRLIFLYMAWLPFEDDIAGESEKLVLKYSPGWSGAGETVHPIYISPEYEKYFDIAYREEYYLDVPFTRESWNGRMKACRGVGASLSEEQISQWESEHKKLLADIAPEHFTVKHYAAIAEMVRR
ncbi:MAG: class I SAM-dependent methyltransferase [Oscillospiraceae bacterium]|nr:class I SAM-dependent methyltransferase [Oscillospiraceae bacterium]MDY2848130.1 class I SAM-dependent methyltransferase [Oscillospiraceae bacterium]